jgi:hypothetical protein
MSANPTMVKMRLDDRLGVAAVAYALFCVKLGPALAVSLVLVFAMWIGWRWLCSKISRRPGGQQRAITASAEAAAASLVKIQASPS